MKSREVNVAKIVAIVEGDGEVKAVPALIRRIHEAVSPGAPLEVDRPIRVRRNRILKAGELERYLALAANIAGADSGILVLLDANGDCPAKLGPDILRRASTARPDRRIEVVLANCEFESWFIAAIDSLKGKRNVSVAATVPQDPESIRGAKEWLRDRMGGTYSPTADQTALTVLFNMELARRRSRSFVKMWRAVGALLRER